MRRHALLAAVALVVLAGCTGGTPGTQSTTTPAATTAHSATTTTTTTETATTTRAADDTPAYGTQYVSVQDTPAKNCGANASTNWKDYENLTDARQQAFTKALEDGQQQYGPNENPPFDFNNKSRPKYVRYNGTCYYVQVAIV